MKFLLQLISLTWSDTAAPWGIWVACGPQLQGAEWIHYLKQQQGNVTPDKTSRFSHDRQYGNT